MKRTLILELIHQLRLKPKLFRKLKIFAALSLVIVLLGGGLLVWAGISMASRLSGLASEAIQSPAAHSQIDKLKAEIRDLPTFNAAHCWSQAQNLLNVESWLAQPLAMNMGKLKAACLGEIGKDCQGPDCGSNSETFKTIEGSAI